MASLPGAGLTGAWGVLPLLAAGSDLGARGGCERTVSTGSIASLTEPGSTSPTAVA
ncbi:MAG: hypothetical protein ABIM50_14240 [Novosphingobium sp.]